MWRLHGYYGPPEANGNAGELIVGIVGEPLGVVDDGGEYDDEEDQEEDEQDELLDGRLERVDENLEARRVLGELE